MVRDAHQKHEQTDEAAKAGRPYSRPYCLSCYALLPKFSGASTHCPHCEAINLRVDQGRLWTRESRILMWEKGLKTLVITICASLLGILLFNRAFGSGVGQGVGYGSPIVIAVCLSLTSDPGEEKELDFLWKSSVPFVTPGIPQRKDASKRYRLLGEVDTFSFH